MMNYLKPFLYFIPLLILQLVAVPLISIFGIVPNLIIILVIYYTLLGGQIYGMILGFLFGFFFDLFSGGVIGASMLAMTVSAFITGYFYNENRVDININTFFFLVILSIASFVESIIYSAVGNFNPDAGIIILLLDGTLFPALYTTLFGVGVVVFAYRKARI
jgi:rod shape-determining protein MreD